MALNPYAKTDWQNGTGAKINETNLDKIEAGISDVTDELIKIENGTIPLQTVSIGNSQVTSEKIASGAVTLPKISTGTTNAGKVLTAGATEGSAIWQRPYGKPFIIAPSNASTTDKQNADFVLTGVDDHVPIQQIIDNLVAQRGHATEYINLYFCSGTVILGVPQILGWGIAPITLPPFCRLNGNNTIFTYPDPVNGYTILNLNHNCELSNLTLDTFTGMDYGITTQSHEFIENCSIKNCEFPKGNGEACGLYLSINNSVVDNVIVNNYLFLRGEHNTLTNIPAFSGPDLSANGVLIQGCYDTTIEVNMLGGYGGLRVDGACSRNRLFIKGHGWGSIWSNGGTIDSNYIEISGYYHDAPGNIDGANNTIVLNATGASDLNINGDGNILIGVVSGVNIVGTNNNTDGLIITGGA